MSKVNSCMNKVSFINYSVLWNKIGGFVRKAGKVGSRPILLLFFVLKSKDTKKEDKALILSALSYIVLPIDVLDAKRLPFIGWIDEIVSLSVAYQKVCSYVTPEMELKADAILEKWFPEYTKYEIIMD